jgi:hypothetical protein
MWVRSVSKLAQTGRFATAVFCSIKVDASVSAGHGVVKVLPAQEGTDPTSIERCALLYNATYDLHPGKPGSYADPAGGITMRLESKRGDVDRVLLTWSPPQE